MKPKTLRYVLASLLAVAVTASCSMHLAYHNVDRLVAWRVDDMLNLTREQRTFVVERVRHHQAWHREQELLRYRHFLDGIEQRIDDGLSEGEVAWFFDQLHEFKSTLMAAISADTAQLLRGVSDEQREHLRQALAKSNRELEKRVALSDRERSRRRAREVIAEIEHWTGRLDRAQRDQVVQELAKLPDMSAPWLAYKRQRQQRLLALLEEPQNDPQFEIALRDWLLESTSAHFAEFRQEAQRVAVAIDRLLTPAQRQHVAEELRKLRDKLDGLRGA